MSGVLQAFAKTLVPKPPGGGGKGGNQVTLNPGLRSGDVSLLKYLASLYGPSQSPQDIGKTASGYVSSSINPIVSNLTAEATREARAGAAAIKGVTDDYASRMGAYGDTVRSDNAAAQTAEKNAGGALTDYLGHEGAASAADVADKVGGGEPAGSALANAGAAAGGAVGQLGQGIAGESAARGYTGLSELIGHGAAAQTAADHLPAQAREEGLQALGGFSSTVTGNLKQQVDALMAQVPGMTAQIAEQLVTAADSNRSNKGSALSSFLSSALDRNTQAAIAKAGLPGATSSQAVAWTNQFGYKTDASGNPVYDASGNLIPTEQSKNDAASTAAAKAADHKTALANLSSARQTALQTVRSIASTALHPKPVKTQVPQVIAGVKTGKFVTKEVTPPTPGYNELLQTAMKQPEVTLLARRFGLKPPEVRDIVVQGLAAAGINPPAAAPHQAAPVAHGPIPTQPAPPYAQHP